MAQDMPPAAAVPQQRSSGRRWLIIGVVAVVGCCLLVVIVMAVSGAALGALGGVLGGLASSEVGQLTIACGLEASDVEATDCAQWAQGIVNDHQTDLDECKQGAVVETDEGGQLTDFQRVYSCLDDRGLGPQ